MNNERSNMGDPTFESAPKEAQDFKFSDQVLDQPEDKETKRKSEYKIACLNSYHSAEDILKLLDETSRETPVGTYAFGEYKVSLEELISKMKELKDFVNEHICQIIIAPSSKGIIGGSLTWRELKKILDDSAIEYEDSIDNSQSVESVGIFISPNQVYAFPKEKSLHRIPNTNIGAMICKEIHEAKSIEPEKLDCVDVIFNPSSEGDDPDLKYKMMFKYGNATETDIRKEIANIHPFRDPQESRKKLLEQLERQNGKEYAEEINEHFGPVESYEEAEREWTEWVNGATKRTMEAIRAEENNDSLYTDLLPEHIKRRIPVIRTDGLSTGILNKVDGQKVHSMNFKGNNCIMDFSLEE